MYYLGNQGFLSTIIAHTDYCTRSSVLCPALKFTDKHEWVRVEGGIGTVGISNYAQVGFCPPIIAHLWHTGFKVATFLISAACTLSIGL